MKIREAGPADIESMVRLSESFRVSLSGYSPMFWRKAENSFETQVAFFRALLPLEATLALVAERNSELAGFIIGRLQEAPPVYAPGGPVCLLDDFCVAAEADWATVAPNLLEAVEHAARTRGAVLSVVICPHLGLAKRQFLQERGFEIASEWHVRAL